MTSHRRHRLLVTGAIVLAGSIIGMAPVAAEDFIDCTPRPDGSALPVACSLAPGQGENEESFDTSRIPGLQVTPGAARTATSFNIGEIAAALGNYASMPMFYVDFGDGTGFGSPTDLKALTSFPSTHVYVNPGNYAITGYASFAGRTESSSATVTIAAPKAEPTPEVTTSSWETASTPEPDSVIPVTSTGRDGTLTLGTAAAVIVERNSKPAARSEAKAPQVIAASGQTVLVNVPSLPAGSKVSGKVRIGSSWSALPPTSVAPDGTVTLPAMTFKKAGTYPVKLSVAGGPARYVKVKVKSRA
jgi:hypothetical protein